MANDSRWAFAISLAIGPALLFSGGSCSPNRGGSADLGEGSDLPSDLLDGGSSDGNDGGLDLPDDPAPTTCDKGLACDEGEVCAGGVCCKEELACGSACCGDGQVCSF